MSWLTTEAPGKITLIASATWWIGNTPCATKIRLVQDNLNTHDGASLYETFRPAEARRILDKIEFHYTPKHGSRLNIAETEINIMGCQCLNRRLDNRSLTAEEIAAWENARNARRARIHWTFMLAVARQKLRKLYPSIEDRRITSGGCVLREALRSGPRAPCAHVERSLGLLDDCAGFPQFTFFSSSPSRSICDPERAAVGCVWSVEFKGRHNKGVRSA